MKPATRHERVVILGAGVTGSSTAIRLLQAGIQPLVVDKARFPRDTVGEGLSPAVGVYLDELGVLEAVDKGPFIKKKSFQLVAPNGTRAYTEIDFERKHYKDGVHQQPWGYNVRRRLFDMVLLERAKKLGAQVELETSATSLVLNASGAVEGVRLRAADGTESTVAAPLVIDCSGRQSVVAQQFELRSPLQGVFEGQWANFAVRLHFSDVNLDALRQGNASYDPATVTIIPDKNCWYWFIPIEENLYSIGFVARSKMNKFFGAEADRGRVARSLLEAHPVLAKVIKNAPMSDDLVFTSRLGHMNTRFAGPGWMCVGDAAFFADPAWATGVTVGLKTSKMASEHAVRSLTENRYDMNAMAAYETDFREFVRDPFNSIRAWNHYYNDSEYLNFIVEELASNQEDMDLIGAILFDYISHKGFDSWTYRVFKKYVALTGRMPEVDKLSQMNFETGAAASPSPRGSDDALGAAS